MRVFPILGILVFCFRADGVDILVAYDDGVDLFDSSSRSFQALVRPSTPVTAVDYHYQRKEAFAAWDSRIYRFPLFLKEYSKPTIVTNITLCWSFTVDWVHDHVFWPNCGIYAAIMMADLDGNNSSKLVQLSEDHPVWVPEIVVDPYRGILFWISDGSLLSCGLDGKDVTTVAKLQEHEMMNLVLDMEAKRVYILGRSKDFVHIYYTGYSGAELQVLLRENNNIWSFNVFRSQMFMCHDLTNGTYLSTVSINNRSSSDQLTITTKTVWHMKIVDSELQSPPEVNECTFRGCSHHCVLESSQAKCRCPRYFKLKSNDKTCEKIYHSQDMFLNILAGIGCILFILLVAGVLMCICDQLWSTIHPTVVRVNDSNVFKRSIYRRNELNENLI